MALVVATDLTLKLEIVLKKQVVELRHCADGVFHSILVNVHLFTAQLDQITPPPRFDQGLDLSSMKRYGSGFNSREIWRMVRMRSARPAFKFSQHRPRYSR